MTKKEIYAIVAEIRSMINEIEQQIKKRDAKAPAPLKKKH
jgi:hypothetical protein